MGDEGILRRTMDFLETTVAVEPRVVDAPAGDRGLTLTDINSATLERLRCLTGIGLFYANRILKGRPYRTTLDLVHKHILPLHTYDRIKDQIVVARP